MTHSDTFSRSVIEFIKTIRRFRQDMALSPKITLDVTWITLAPCNEDLMLLLNEDRVSQIVNVRLMVGDYTQPHAPDSFILPLWNQTTLAIPMGDDLPKLATSLSKQLTTLERERRKVRMTISAPDFMTRAPIEVIDENRRNLEDLDTRYRVLLPMYRLVMLRLWLAFDPENLKEATCPN